MKKLLCVLFLLCLTPVVYASANSDIKSLRAVKQVKTKVINNEIKELKSELTTVLLNDKLTYEEKEKRTAEIQKEISALYEKREQNVKEYRIQKNKIKKNL